MSGSKNHPPRLQRDSGLEDRDFAVTFLFVVDVASVGHFQEVADESVQQQLPWIRPGRWKPALKSIQPGFVLEQGGVGGNLQRGHETAEGRTAAGSEEDHLTACCAEGGSGDQVVCRGLRGGSSLWLPGVRRRKARLGQRPCRISACKPRDFSSRVEIPPALFARRRVFHRWAGRS